MKAYAYVIATDSGVAPNFEAPMPTLAICKPKIRLGAESGDFVIGFTGKDISPEPHGVCWAGVIQDKRTLEEYWNDPKFDSKKPNTSTTPDNIYKPSGGFLIQVPNSSHGHNNLDRDVGGRYVLSFDPAWYFGNAAPVLPDNFGLRMIGGRRGHRTVELTEAKWRKLQTWLHAQAENIEVTPSTSHGRPVASQKPARRCS